MPCDSPYTVQLHSPFVRSDGSVQRYAEVPCGSCGVCRKNRVDEWVFRLQQEQKDSHSAYFVTLTYASDFLPRSPNNLPSLDRRDITLYFKRLRTWMYRDGVDMPKFKYYIVGEYGSENDRPHYHGVFLNASYEHILEAWNAERGFKSEIVRTDKTGTLWTAGFGNVHIDSVNNRTIAYTLKYLDKGRKVPAHSRDDRVKEFSRCSQHIGKGYLTPAMINWHKADLSRNYIITQGKKIALPRYYRDKIFNDTEKEIQRNLAIDAKESLEQQSVKEFFTDYPSATMADYELDQEFKKLGRYRRFTNNQNRKL